MRPTIRLAVLSVALAGQALSAFAQSTPARQPASPRSFNPANLDRSADPCNDFYQFACGGWLAKNPVPADQARYGRFDELREANQEALHAILEKAAKENGQRQAIDQKIGDYYASCMDEKAIEAKGTAPLKPLLDPIAAFQSKAELPALLARLHAAGVDALFSFGAQPDLKNSSVYIAFVDQDGLGLPDRDYYLGEEPRLADIRKQYPGHVQRMFQLLGESPETAAKSAQTVLDIETALARASIDRVRRRDPRNRDNKMTRDQLAALAPNFDWNAYFKATGAPAFAELNVSWPDFLKGMDEQLAARSVEEWKTYLRWHALRRNAPMLPAAFVQENFAFFNRTLTGARELEPRWKRCAEWTNRQLGEALGQRYVEAHFGPESKERMLQLVEALEVALERDIRELPWMTEATKVRALEKLAAIGNKIGYPEKWRDYSTYQVTRGDALGNLARGSAFDMRRRLDRIGKKVDPLEWQMTPPTVNASYSPPTNYINFPAGILQPPFFDMSADDAINFGAIGGVIGHELTHGFDDQGRKYDPKGNLIDWWTPEDGAEFEKRASCIADQYSEYTVAGGVKLNGRLTLGENTADNGGVRIALMALQDTLKGKKAELRDGFTPEQRLFLGWSQVWCQNSTDESAKMRVQTDPHSPGRYRVNGVVSNMPEFQKAFNCPAGSPMVRENACRVW